MNIACKRINEWEFKQEQESKLSDDDGDDDEKPLIYRADFLFLVLVFSVVVVAFIQMCLQQHCLWYYFSFIFIFL